MPSKLQIIKEMAAQEALSITSDTKRYMAFLHTAANNYKYDFQEQLLIHAQKPDATACAEIDTWNKLGRWVNKGTKGIALLIDRDVPYKLRYVFDLSDTNSRAGREVNLWQLKDRYLEEVKEALSNSFGEVVDADDFQGFLMQIAEHVVNDNLDDYAADLTAVKAGSLLEELDELNTKQWLRHTLVSSVGYMLMTRCGLDANELYSFENFAHVLDFNTHDTIGVLGVATSDISEMVLREIEATVRALQREEKANARTFANQEQNRYHESRNKQPERRIDHESDLYNAGRLSASESGSSGGSESGQVWNAAAQLPAEPQESAVHRDDVVRQIEPAPAGSGSASEHDAGEPAAEDGAGAGRDRESESDKPDDVGSADEQPPAGSRGERSGGSGLQLSGRNGNFVWDVEYFYQDKEKNELLRTCERLKDHRKEIAAFFASHPDKEERGNFVKGFFDNTFYEHILGSGQRVGYRAYDDVLHLWRGAYLSREREEYMRWRAVESRINGMILMDTWLDASEKPLPTVEEQQQRIYHADSKDGPGFDLPQAAIDYVLVRGSGVSQGKLRIFQQFQKNEPKEANIAFLKQEYGMGGSSDAIPGSGIWEDHDVNGIRLYRFSPTNKEENAEFLVKWPMAEKRIRELIEANRYLSPKEAEAYPQFLRDTEVRQQRHALVEEFRAIIYDYNDFREQVGDKQRKFDQYQMAGILNSFSTGEKTAQFFDKQVFVLPVMREAMERIIGENTHHADRARVMLEKLSGEITHPFEPTYDERNPPPPIPREYKLSLGDTLYIGAQQYELLALGDQEVTLFDPAFPLFHQAYPRQEFFDLLKENPLNDKYLQEVEVVPETEEPAGDVPFDAEEPSIPAAPDVQSSAEDGQLLNGDPVAEILPPPAPKPKERISAAIIHPQIPTGQRHNFRIIDDDLGVGTPGQRYANNVAAIRLLKRLDAESRLATPEEQEVLSKYVGWGGLSACFEEKHSKYQELKTLLTEEEYAAARESSLTAFYTPPVVIRAMFKAIENMGFKRGNVLEPSCGVGNFLGMLPDSMQESQLYGVELDSISGRIAQQLYQKSSIAVQGFEKTELPDSFFDAAIGNVPFGQFKVPDKQYDKHNFLIHDYFFARTLDKVRPGGIVAFITSKGTMDKENPAVRKYIAQRADLLGAIRLPNDTFKSAAGTEVTSDIIFLQQREGRIVRQGNMHDEVDIYTYVTENTFDSYLYQLVESKQKFVGQIMTSKSPVRSAEDIDETALSYAEIKALCTGNPYIKEKMDLDIDVQRLRLMKASHLSQRYALEDQIIKKFPQEIASYEQIMQGLEADITAAKEHTHPNEDGFSPMVIEGVVHSNKKAAGSAILEVCRNMTTPDPISLGQYRGFAMQLHFDSMKREYVITLQGQLSHPVSLGTDIFGNIQRLDNVIESFPERVENCRALLENVHHQLEAAKTEAQAPFPREDELKAKSARLDELNILLNLDKKENEIVDGERDDNDEERPRQDRGAR